MPRGALTVAFALLVVCGCLLSHLSVTAYAAAPQEETAAPLALHTSLVELFNADKSQWTISLASTHADAAAPADAAAAAVRWTDMREVWVEGQPAESAASLLFALPPPTSSYYQLTDIAEEEAAAAGDAAANTISAGEKDIVQGDSVVLRAQRRHLFGQAAFAFHGLSCEEYGAAERSAASHHRHSGSSSDAHSTTALRGRCYLLRDSGEDVFFNYRVEAAGPAGQEGGEEEGEGRAEGAAAHRRGGRGGSAHARRHRRARATEDATAAAVPSSTPATSASAATPSVLRAPQTSSHTSAGDVWTEYIVLPGAESGVVGAEGDVRVGRVELAEHLTTASDAAHSTRVELTFAVTFFDAKDTATPAAVLHVRVKGVTGAYCEQAVRKATLAQQAARTSVFNRWIFPLVYVGCLYGLVYGVAWLQTQRKAAAAAAAAAGGAPANAPAVTKKQQ